ncbi:hypothetical protein MP228_004354 [Amoeboaphelidium protococcarum]|nr:hypothetical protein MP228_004354 [Amoeboaphelidium protococcarum]
MRVSFPLISAFALSAATVCFAFPESFDNLDEIQYASPGDVYSGIHEVAPLIDSVVDSSTFALSEREATTDLLSEVADKYDDLLSFYFKASSKVYEQSTIYPVGVQKAKDLLKLYQDFFEQRVYGVPKASELNVRFWHVFSQYRRYRLYRNIVKAQSLLKQYIDYLTKSKEVAACVVPIDPYNVDWNVCKNILGQTYQWTQNFNGVIRTARQLNMVIGNIMFQRSKLRAKGLLENQQYQPQYKLDQSFELYKKKAYSTGFAHMKAQVQRTFDELKQQ